MVFAKVRGQFRKWQGTLRLSPDDLTQSSVVVDIEADSIDTGSRDRDQHLRSADFFDVERFPKLHFESGRVAEISDGRLKVSGELTLHGVTRDVDLDVRHNGNIVDPFGQRRAAFTATTSVNRKDFGLEWNQVLETGGVLVGDEISIELEIEAVENAGVQAA
jgi:polyisoprenoid-binding protein YceI